MKFLFIRHGQTDFNLQGIIQGQEKDPPLNATGVAQVEAAAPLLPDTIDFILSSPLKRAAQTADIINVTLHKKIEYRDELKEFKYGSLTGKTWPEIEKETNGSSTKEKDENITFDYTPYGGESADDLKRRVGGLVRELKETYPDKTILITSHGGVIDTMHVLFPQKEKLETKNASIHEFIF